MMKKIFRVLALAVAVFAVSCSGKNFSEGDLKIIHSNPDSLLHIYTVENPAELEVLRTPSVMLSKKALHSDDFKKLTERMVQTVSHPSVDGLGLAAPQIGINKAIIAVKRIDLEDKPVIIYPNITIEEYSTEMDIITEGCLSVPEKKNGYIDRAIVVAIKYYSLEEQKMVKDTISTYASVIFQHEVDHLNGILYTDRLW